MKMTSKKYIECKLKYLTNYDPSLSFDINMHRNILQDLDRLEELEKENAKLKKAIEILKNKLKLNVEETFFPPAYNDMSDYGEYDWFLNVFNEFINLQDYEYELLKEVLGNDK